MFKLWCYFGITGCGQILPIYEAKKESKLQDFVQPSTNPFNEGKSITGLDNKVKKTPFQKEIQKLKDRIEQEKDEDIKRESTENNQRDKKKKKGCNNKRSNKTRI
jgi:hypothetical protein